MLRPCWWAVTSRAPLGVSLIEGPDASVRAGGRSCTDGLAVRPRFGAGVLRGVRVTGGADPCAGGSRRDLAVSARAGRRLRRAGLLGAAAIADPVLVEQQRCRPAGSRIRRLDHRTVAGARLGQAAACADRALRAVPVAVSRGPDLHDLPVGYPAAGKRIPGDLPRRRSDTADRAVVRVA